MKAAFIILILFVTCRGIYSQESGYDRTASYSEIISHLKSREYYVAINKMNIFLLRYPGDAGMYFNRGIAKYFLNEYLGMREDLIKSKQLGFNKKDKLINALTSKSYMANQLTKHYIRNIILKEENGFKPVFGYKDSLQGALRPERTCFDVYYYNLTVKILPRTKSIEGSNQIYFKTTQRTNKIQIDLSGNFRILSINWKGKELKYNRVFNAIFINFDDSLPTDEKEIITINYSGKPRIAPSPPWDGGFVWKRNHFHRWIGVACEHLGASSWWPCKDHLTEKPDSMSINVQVPTGYQAISNGNLRSTHTIDKSYTNFEWFVSYPINSYGVTFYMGKFVNFNEVFTNSNGSYYIDYYVLPHHLELAKKYYSQTKDIVKVYEKYFGEYPYKKDGMAMIEAPFEGMEHQSAIAIGDGYGKKKHRNYENKDYDYLVVHETAHEWWGNTIAVGDMADAWISEGFATYAELLFMEDKFGYEEYLSGCSKDMLNIFNIWPIVGIRDVNDNSFIGGDIYHKGAIMLNNLRCIIDNDSTFFAIIKGFYNQYKFKIVSSSDFVRFVNENTGKDYSSFFNKFLYCTDPPILQYKFNMVNGNLFFTYKWINVDNNFTMPFSITLNEDKNYRLNGSTDYQTFKAENVNAFYLPNEKKFKKEQISKNSFTYYWTSWIQ